MLTLSTASIIEKNQISATGIWLMLLEIEYSKEVIRLVHNTENIMFQSNEYIAFPFTLSDLTENATDLPNIKLSVSNVTRTIQRMADANNGFTGANVTIRVINTNISDISEIEESFIITTTEATAEWVSFTLRTNFSFQRRFPLIRIMKDFCPFKFKGVQCGYKGNGSDCNKTLVRCRQLGNNMRFGGEPTIPQGGLYVGDR